MPRETVFEVPADPSQFSTAQVRPRVLLGLSMQSLARWLASYLVPYPRLLTRHHVGFVFTWARLDYATPDLRFGDSNWLVVTGRLGASATGKYLRMDAAIRAGDQADAPAQQPVGRVRADLRIVSVVEGEALTAVPGALPATLLGAFSSDEIYQPDRAAITRESSPPSGTEIAPPASFEVSLYRTHCEVADQWSFIEVVELLTAARERLYVQDTAPAGVGKLAVGLPVRSIVAVFHHAMFVFDACKITTRAVHADDGPGDGVAFVHTVGYPDSAGTCVTAWEILRPS